MVETIRNLEDQLRNIKLACRNAIDDVTGRVDGAVLTEQSAALKLWVANLENTYIQMSKTKPKNAESILKEGALLTEEAWQTYQYLANAALEANTPQPTQVKWENLPYGVVTGEVKAQILTELDKLLQKYKTFRRDILQI